MLKVVGLWFQGPSKPDLSLWHLFIQPPSLQQILLHGTYRSSETIETSVTWQTGRSSTAVQLSRGVLELIYTLGAEKDS